jgi:hypothetical protein
MSVSIIEIKNSNYLIKYLFNELFIYLILVVMQKMVKKWKRILICSN